LEWQPRRKFEQGLIDTIDWHLHNESITLSGFSSGALESASFLRSSWAQWRYAVDFSFGQRELKIEIAA
jgi:hypothetical protein